jgi:hypothetical protein
MVKAISIQKIALIGGIVLTAMIMLLCAWSAANGAGPASAEAIGEGLRHDGQTMTAGDLLARIIEIAAGADNADELQARLENDPLVQASGLIPGSDIMVSSTSAGDCHLSPLLCLFKWDTPDLSCVYDCIGPRGTGALTCRHQEECDFLAGCIMFENCLALCISIIPHDLQPVIWW